MSSWGYALLVLGSLLVGANSNAVGGCEGSPPPLYQLIPATMVASSHLIPLQFMPTLRRVPRQSAVQQSVVVNQNANSGFGGLGFGGHGFGGHSFGGHSFGSHGFGGHGFGSRPIFSSRPTSIGKQVNIGGFSPFLRSYEQPQAPALLPQPSVPRIPAPTCGSNYLLSCQPTLSPVPCSSGSNGAY